MQCSCRPQGMYRRGLETPMQIGGRNGQLEGRQNAHFRADRRATNSTALKSVTARKRAPAGEAGAMLVK